MIQLNNLCKTFVHRGVRKIVADNITAEFPTGKSVGLLGRNGAGKSSLLQMIAGKLDPDSGEILSDGSISWPVGFAGSFHRDLSGSQNTKFIARAHGVDTEELIDFVEDFADLGRHFLLPVRTYSAGMRSRLAFGISMGIRFDTYLVDEVTSVGDQAFREKSLEVFNERMGISSAIFVSHGMGMIKQMCDSGAVLEGGVLSYYDDIDEAIEVHKANMSGPKP